MKRFFIFITALWILITLACDPNPSPELSTEYPKITKLFTPAAYSGPGRNISSIPVVSSDSRLILDCSFTDNFEADAYFDLPYVFTDDGMLPPYLLLSITKGSDTIKYYLPVGSDTLRIWLRQGEGFYNVSIYKIVEIHSMSAFGVIYSFTYSGTAVTSFTVTNTNSEDGTFIYPSPEVQSDESEILSAAENFSGETADELIKEIHDYIVLSLKYDSDSVDNSIRRKQDALTVLDYQAAVCDGYSNLFMALLRARGIPAQYISGGNHAWTRVCNGTVWKEIDTTWDDPITYISGHPNSGTSDFPDGENLKYTYFWKESFSDHTYEDYSTTRAILPQQDGDFITEVYSAVY